MKIIALTMARGGSKGIPRKNLLDFCGKPLIGWTIEQCLQSSFIQEVYVSTEDNEIADVSKSIGAKIINRPLELAGDTTSSEDVLLHALEQIECDIVVFPQVTSPIRFSDDFDKSLKQFKDESLDSLFSSSELEDYCIWNSKMESITYDYKNRGRRQTREKIFLENGSFYIFRPDGINNYKNRLHGKIGMYLMESWKSCEIDSYENIPICEFYMYNNILNKRIRYV